MKTLSILIVEDDLLSRIGLMARLECHGRVYEASSAREAIALAETVELDMAFVDLDLEHELAGLQVLKNFSHKNIHTIVLSAREDDDVVSNAYDFGCSDYLSKPYNKEAVEAVVARYKNQGHAHGHLQRLKQFFMTNDPSMIDQLQLIEQAIFGFHPVLITGETGTGKTFLAKFIHELIGKDRPFVHLNCAEISESLMESELFGHCKGAFTGAIKDKKGLLEMANGGMVFLDEIATLPPSLQKKLLKAIEEKSFYPVGAEKSVASSFRLISATCEDLSQKVANGEFRQDLLFRLEGFNVHLKSLRERREDLPNMAKAFLKKGSRRIVLSGEAWEVFMQYSWPGNVRELEKTIDILKSRSAGIIVPKDLEGLLGHEQKRMRLEACVDNLDYIKQVGLNNYIEMLEGRILEKVLQQNKDKVRKTMSDLKLSNNSFYRIMTNLRGASHEQAGDGK